MTQALPSCTQGGCWAPQLYHCSCPRSGSKEVCVPLYTTVVSASLHSLLHLHSSSSYPLLPPLIFFSLPLSSSPFPYLLLPSLIFSSLPLSSPPSPYLLLPPLILFSPFSYSPSSFTSISLYCSDWQCSKKSIGNLGCSTRRTTGPFFLTRDLSIARGLVG